MHVTLPRPSSHCLASIVRSLKQSRTLTAGYVSAKSKKTMPFATTFVTDSLICTLHVALIQTLGVVSSFSHACCLCLCLDFSVHRVFSPAALSTVFGPWRNACFVDPVFSSAPGSLIWTTVSLQPHSSWLSLLHRLFHVQPGLWLASHSRAAPVFVAPAS